MLILEDIARTLSEKKQQRGENALKIKECSEKRQILGQMADQLLTDLNKNSEIQKKLEAEEEELKAFLDAYSLEKTKVSRLLEVYHVQDENALAGVISEQFRKAVLDGELKRQEIKKLERELENLSQGIPTVPTPAMEAVVEYIRRCHGLKCVFGGDYLKEVSDYDRRILLERIPFLPESVILESGMAGLREDRVLLEKDFGEGIVPVISLSQVLEQKEAVLGKDVLFLSKNPDLYINTEVREELCRKVEKDLEEVRTALERLEDREQTIESDRHYITGVELNYRKYYAERLARRLSVVSEREDIQRKIAGDSERLRICELDSERLEKDLGNLQSEAEGLDKELEVLQKMQTLDETLKEIQLKIQGLKDALGKNKRARQEAEEKFKWAEKTLEQLLGQKKMLNDRLAKIDETWKNLYEVYYSDGETEHTDMTAEAADARFRGLKEAYEKEHSNLEDKQRLLENYSQMMDKCLHMIEKRGGDAAVLDAMAKEHRLLRTEASEISSMEKELLRLKGDIDAREEALFQYQENKNKLFGSVAQGVRMIEEKYGAFEQIHLNSGDYSDFEVQQKKALEAVLEKKSRAEEGIKNTWRELRTFEDIKRDLERTIRNENILFNRTKDTYRMDFDIHKKYRELNEKHLRLRAELQRKREGYEKDRIKAAEELGRMSAAELSEVIRREAAMPESYDDAAVLIQQLAETTAIIRLEKERIEKAIQDMMQIKENFENSVFRDVSVSGQNSNVFRPIPRLCWTESRYQWSC